MARDAHDIFKRAVRAVEKAMLFKKSSILAVDISASSLCYAMRKTEEYQIENIEYMQADILDLGGLKRDFDLIECGGVLHHMNNLERALKNLTTLLRPDGHMYLGFYSELARGEKGFNVTEIINLAKTLAINEDLNSIRAFRQKLIETYYTKENSWGAGKFLDFFSASEFRDLFLHRHEVRMTIPKIKKILSDTGLEFKGFASLKGTTLEAFTHAYGSEDALLDLDKWAGFEAENPKTFIGMYQFWCKKL